MNSTWPLTTDGDFTNNTNFTSASNSTFTDTFDLQSLAYFNIPRTILAFLTNSVTLYAFLITPSLQSPFNIYLICLLGANFLSTVGEGPFDIYMDLNPVWMLGNHVCSLYLYTTWTLFGWIVHLHLSITINRFWAVFWPIHYRQHHNRHIAVLICCVTFIYSHLVNTPFIVLDELYYRLPLEKYGCTNNTDAQTVYYNLLMFIHFDAPIAAIVIGCVVVLFKKNRNDLSRRTRMVRPFEPAGISANRATRECPITTNRIANSVVIENARLGVHTAARKSHGSLIMGLLTISIVICWIPNNAYFTAVSLKPDYYDHNLDVITSALLLLQSALDPILFSIALQDVRIAIKNIFRNPN